MNKIFKKYWYCLVANLFLLFKQYNQALQYFSHVSRYDFFLLNSSDAAASAGAYSTPHKPFVVRGGVGDILQSVPFMLKNRDRDYLVLTHFKSAEVFLRKLICQLRKFIFTATPQSIKKKLTLCIGRMKILYVLVRCIFKTTHFLRNLNFLIIEIRFWGFT